MKPTDSAPETTIGDSTDVIVSAQATDLTVNAAFFQEIKDDNVRLQQLLLDVKSSLDSASLPRRGIKQFVEQLCELRDQLAMHFALEEAYGYFDNAVDVAPELSSLAESLRSEHSAIFAEIRDLAERAEGLAYQDTPRRRFHHVVARTRAFCDQLHRHECRENDLILRAFNDDIGVGD